MRSSVPLNPEALTPRNMEFVLTIRKKFGLALIAYAVLGVLAWTTLSDEPIQVFNANVRLRTGTLLILGLFAFRAALYFWRARIEEEREARNPQIED
jgi:asparagine N-glycosylation enzyme membrane subunit Stt3